MYKRIAFSGLAILGLAAGGIANAAEGPGFYVGVGLGQTNLEVDDTDFDGDDTGFKLFGGYSFNENFAVELTYFDGGSIEEDGLGLDVSGIGVSVLGNLPLSEAFSIYGRLGFTSYDTDTSASGIGSASGGKEDVAYGIGANWNIGPTFSLRGEYEFLDISEIISDIDLDASGGFFSISGVFSF